ncbi:hypothetical protein OG233_21705 [Streptomyces sp. NBC_01218]|uniref:hypothetical protein n=1 Tax=Streptomyces sp. NBC_01218 TaxID=2903780 RepID=UPI002E0F82A2|nr:hypothetical protein OG233_21705 [Streptomyces sp. NBC_01218]
MPVPDADVPAQEGPRRPIPTPGTLMVDTRIENRVGEFRGVAGPYWSLRPVCGGIEWEAAPEFVRSATPIERLGAENARCNARSRGDVL